MKVETYRHLTFDDLIEFNKCGKIEVIRFDISGVSISVFSEGHIIVNDVKNVLF